jgi:hypothetical protein
MLAALALTPGPFSAQAAAAPNASALTSRDVAPALAGNHIVNHNSGKCLVTRDTAPGTGAVQTPCASFADQNWILEIDAAGFWNIRNAHTNLCLAVRSRNLEEQVVDAPCFTSGDTVRRVLDAADRLAGPRHFSYFPESTHLFREHCS